MKTPLEISKRFKELLYDLYIALENGLFKAINLKYNISDFRLKNPYYEYNLMYHLDNLEQILDQLLEVLDNELLETLANVLNLFYDKGQLKK